MQKELVVVGPDYKPTNKSLRGDIKIDWCYTIKCIVGTVGYFTLTKTPIHWATSLPDFDTGKSVKISLIFLLRVRHVRKLL